MRNPTNTESARRTAIETRAVVAKNHTDKRKNAHGAVHGVQTDTRAKLAGLAGEKRIERQPPQGKRKVAEHRASDPAQCVRARQPDTADSAALWRAILSERS